MKLIDETTGQEVKVGDQVISFRGEGYVLENVVEPNSPLSSGRVYVKPLDGGIREVLFPSVFGLKIINHQFDN